MSMPSLARAIAAAILSMCALAPSGAGAQNFERPVRLIVPFAPGGTSDILARLISPKLSVAIGQSVVVENKPGAAGNLGADAVAKAQPDGHTLFVMDVASRRLPICRPSRKRACPAATQGPGKAS